MLAIWLLLPLVVLATAGVRVASAQDIARPKAPAPAAAMPQDEFERRVRTYLLDHPEVLVEAINRLEARQREEDAKQAQAVVRTHADEVFRDPDSPVGGNPDGDVTVVEFFDYNCPYCHAMAPVMTQAETADPQLRIVYKEFPILGPGSLFAAKAALAANKQGKYVAFHRALYQVRGPIDENKVLETARKVGLDVERLKADMQDAAIQSALDRTGKLAEALRITGTPGFVIADKVTTGATDLKTFQALIAEVRSSRAGAK
jgi:protein-disulfide isomerase